VPRSFTDKCEALMNVKVLFILGTARSGSTIIDNILNEVDGFFSVGEVRFLWERILQSRWCGCGRPFEECPIWSVVLHKASGVLEGSKLDVEEIVRWQRENLRVRHTWRLLRASQSLPTHHASLDSLRRVTEAVYSSVSEVTGARVIIDSSKRSSDAALLHLLPSVSAYFLHLVRDPRAVAYSRERPKMNPDRATPGQMDVRGPVNSALSWTGWNLTAEVVTRRYGSSRSIELRYEDFTAKPAESIRRILHLMDEDGVELPFTSERTVQLRGNHTVSGNPARFTTGPITIREDDEWLGQMSSAHKMAVTFLTLPLMLRYGYPIVPDAGVKPPHR
jgi:hypothetical protein